MAANVDRWIAVLGVAVALVIGWVTIGATYTTAKWGGSPPKSLSARYYGPSDPLLDLADAESRIAVALKSGSQRISNLRIVQAVIENNGSAPILPTDMIEPLSITTDSPWKIVNIANLKDSNASGIKLRWSRVTDDKFVSNPTLINPGDRIVATVYLTWLGNGDVPIIKKAPIRWDARISNLNKIDDDFSPVETLINKAGPVFVVLSGWGVPFTILAIALYNALSVSLILNWSALRRSLILRTLTIAFATVLNVAAAESGSSMLFREYVFGNSPNLAMNLPAFLLNAAMIFGLSAIVYAKRGKH